MLTKKEEAGNRTRVPAYKKTRMAIQLLCSQNELNRNYFFEDICIDEKSKDGIMANLKKLRKRE